MHILADVVRFTHGSFSFTLVGDISGNCFAFIISFIVGYVSET